jgi:hypothetical protein
VLRGIFGPKMEEVTGVCIKLHNDELRNLYSSPDIIRMIKSRKVRWARHEVRMGVKRNAHKIVDRKPQTERLPGRPRRKFEDTIKIYLKETGW